MSEGSTLSGGVCAADSVDYRSRSKTAFITVASVAVEPDRSICSTASRTDSRASSAENPMERRVRIQAL